MKKVFKEILSWNFYFLISLIVVIFINVFVVQFTQVSGHSMDDTLHHTERVFINKLPHTFKLDYKHGEIVVIDSRVDQKSSLMDEVLSNFRNNRIVYYFTKEQDEFYWIKRVIGVEGDVLEFKDGQVYRNGQLLDEPYTKDEINKYSISKVVVPKGHVFVMGDNRAKSGDSRDIGFVPVDHVLGKFWFSIF